MSLEGLDTELGEYRLRHRIALGGMAEVFLADVLDPAAHDAAEVVVVKRLLPKLRAEPDFVSLFLDEARLSVKLRHPHVVRTFKAFRKHIDYYMIQEFVDGASLAALTARLRKRRLRLPAAAALHTVLSLLKALDYVHRAKLKDQHVRLVHRDVNPGNILLARSGAVKLGDFGVAEGEGIGATRVRGALRGTPAYMAPEQVRGQLVDPRTDLYSVGIVLWELLAGRDLFLGESEFETLRRIVEHDPAPPSVYAPDLPAELDAVVARALSRDADERFQSAGQFGRALLELTRREGWDAETGAGLLSQAVALAMA